MSRTTVVFLIIAAVLAGIFARLGFWQVSRLHERQEFNAMVERGLAADVRPLRDVLADTGRLRLRRVTASGRFDYQHEVALGSRSNLGSPGVNLLTPLQLIGTDTIVWVNRGWVYAPDAMSADFARWREADSADISGFLLEFQPPEPAPVSSPTHPRVVRRAEADSLAARIAAPQVGYMLVQTSGGGENTPVRIPVPALDEGPHRSYAIQWFAFAAVAIVGGLIAVLHDRTRTGRSRNA